MKFKISVKLPVGIDMLAILQKSIFISFCKFVHGQNKLHYYLSKKKHCINMRKDITHNFFAKHNEPQF